MSANGAGQFVSVHDRHVAIDNHQIERLGFPCLKSRLAIRRDAESVAQRPLPIKNKLMLLNFNNKFTYLPLNKNSFFQLKMNFPSKYRLSMAQIVYLRTEAWSGMLVMCFIRLFE
jgi:hypothetical protein